MRLTRFAKYAWGVLAYNVVVILWGAFVRATGSGAGCGSHWPLCNGEVLPRAARLETLIEFTHRVTSGLSLLLVIGLLVWAYRAHSKGHPARSGAGLAMFFMVTEALLGAVLVLLKWVALDASIGRVLSVAAHLINTFLLLASLVLTAWWASGGETLRLKGRGLVLWVLGLGCLGVIVLGASGAITALGDTLFPASSLAEGVQQDFSPTAHFLIRLRVWHPIVAITVGFYLVFVSNLLSFLRPNPTSKRFTLILTMLIVLQLAAGLINWLLLAPIWMQLVHLFLADSVWIMLILLSATALGQETAETQADQPSQPTPFVEARGAS